MIRSTISFALVSFAFVACSSGSPPPVSESKSLSALTPTESSSLCSWEQTQLTNVSCNGKPVTGFCSGGTANFSACTTRTVGDYEKCIQANKGCDAVGAIQNCLPLLCIAKGAPSGDAGK